VKNLTTIRDLESNRELTIESVLELLKNSESLEAAIGTLEESLPIVAQDVQDLEARLKQKTDTAAEMEALREEGGVLALAGDFEGAAERLVKIYQSHLQGTKRVLASEPESKKAESAAPVKTLVPGLR